MTNDEDNEDDEDDTRMNTSGPATRALLGLVLAAGALLVAACGGSEDADARGVGAGDVAAGAPAAAAQSPAPVDAPATSGAAAASASFDFPTGPAVLVEPGYEPPNDRVDSTGAYLPVNGKPTVVVVDAIWCPTCALTRPVFHRLRPEYQDDINLVVLDFDRDDDATLAKQLGAWAHPAWAVIAPDSDEVLERRFGPMNERGLRQFLDGIREKHAGS